MNDESLTQLPFELLLVNPVFISVDFAENQPDLSKLKNIDLQKICD